MNTPTLAPNSAAVAKAYAEDPITLLDDLVQFLVDDGHADLSSAVHDVLLVLDARRHAIRAGA